MAEELLRQIEEYWSTRTEGYSEVNDKELEGTQKDAWLSVLEENFPKKEKTELRILDVGTGPGFFPVILTRAGYKVTAVDYTRGMLEKAAANVRSYGLRYGMDLSKRVTFLRMDAQNLEFEDESFDVIVSRNLSWNLEKPAQAYSEWCRVLNPGGVFMNFDANWYGYLYDVEKKKAYEQDRMNVQEKNLDDHYLCTDIDTMERIALQMPLSGIERPDWDLQILDRYGLQEIRTDREIWKRVWSREEKLNYGSTPMFMVCGSKKQRGN